MRHGARPLRSTRRLANLTQGLPAWYSIRNQADGAPTLVSIYDEIGFLGVSAASFMDELRQVQGDIEMHINSPGGDVFDGIAIFNQLKQAGKRGTVHVVVDGLAASAASFIAMAASPGRLEMAPHSRLMIHDGFGMAIGNAADMREMADLLDDASDNIASMYAGRTGKPVAYWRDKMRTETWYSGDQAVAEGLADSITGADGEPKPGDWDLSVYARAGAAPVNQLGEVYVPEKYQRNWNESVQCPHCRKFNATDASFCDQCGWKLVGKTDVAESGPGGAQFSARKPKKGKRGRQPTRADPDPDHDGDDDETAAGDTDHDYVKPDGKPGPKAKPKKAKARTALPIRAAKPEVDRSKWDGPKAMSAASKADDPAAAFRAICAGRRSGPPAEEKSWALPYRKTPSSPPNADGVRDALSRLPQTDGLTNAEEARSKLEGLMKDVNPDYKPGDKIDPALLQAALAIGLEGVR